LLILLHAGADVNAKKNDGSTALMIAALHDHADIVLVLLDAGAEVNAKTAGGNTALIWAGCKGHVDVVRVLLEYGADGDALGNYGTHLKIVEQLIGGYQAEEFSGANLLGDYYVKGFNEMSLLLGGDEEKNVWMVHGDQIYSLSPEQHSQVELLLNPVFQEKVRAKVGNDLADVERRLKKGEDLVIYETVNVCRPQPFPRLEFSRRLEGSLNIVYVNMFWAPLAASGDVYTWEKDPDGNLALIHRQSIWVS